MIFKYVNHNSEDYILVNPLSANPTKWSNTLKQFVGKADELFKCV